MLLNIVVTKAKTYVSVGENHSSILDKNGIDKSLIDNYALYEVFTPDVNVNDPIDEWTFRRVVINKTSNFPEWLDEERVVLMIKSIEKFIDEHSFKDLDSVVVNGGRKLFISNCKNVTILGSTYVDVVKNSHIKRISGNSRIGIAFASRVDDIRINARVDFANADGVPVMQ